MASEVSGGGFGCVGNEERGRLQGQRARRPYTWATLHSWPRQPARSHTPSTVREGGEAHQVDDDIITPKAAQVRRGDILRLLKQSGKMVNIISVKGERGNVFYKVTVCILVLPSCDKQFDKCKQHPRGNPARLRRPSQNWLTLNSKYLPPYCITLSTSFPYPWSPMMRVRTSRVAPPIGETKGMA